MNGLPTAPNAVPPSIQIIFWVISIFIAAIVIGGSLTWWLGRQHSQTRRELYGKIKYVERDLKEHIDHNKEECGETKNRVALLEQAHEHIEKQMEDMGGKLDEVASDVSGTKENLAKLEAKSAEQHLTVVGEIRGLGDKILISQLQKQLKD